VVAGHAWRAEVLAKALVLRSAPACFADIDAPGAAAFTVDDDGQLASSAGMRAFVAEPLPPTLSRAS
jgi:hypothetical protein